VVKAKIVNLKQKISLHNLNIPATINSKTKRQMGKPNYLAINSSTILLRLSKGFDAVHVSHEIKDSLN
jgi:hypothetical protein